MSFAHPWLLTLLLLLPLAVYLRRRGWGKPPAVLFPEVASLRSAFEVDVERAYKDERESDRALGAGVGYAAGSGGESALGVVGVSDRAFWIFNRLRHPRTEVVEAKKHGRKIDGVAIPAPLNKADKVGYAIGVLSTGRNQDNGRAYLDYLATERAQEIYASYGFVTASAEELALKPIP